MISLSIAIDVSVSILIYIIIEIIDNMLSMKTEITPVLQSIIEDNFKSESKFDSCCYIFTLFAILGNWQAGK